MGTLVEAYQDAGCMFHILNRYPSRGTAHIVISMQTQVTGGYIGETGISTPFSRADGCGLKFSHVIHKARLLIPVDVEQAIFFPFFGGGRYRPKPRRGF